VLSKKALSQVLALFLISALPAFSQKPTPQPAAGEDANPTFKSQSRLVVVDVVARDPKGRLIVGLKPGNFQVMENGVPQKISFFEDHTAARVKPTLSKIQLPANQYTNYPTERPKDTLNILLFDLINTPTRDQSYARKEMLKALENLPKGHDLALFVLGSRLQMIQGPSGDTEALIAAARTVLSTPSRMVQDNTQIAAENDRLAGLEQQAGSGGFGAPSPVDEQLRVALTKEQSNLTQTRLEYTLSSLEAIARIVSGYAGRKNLIWITAGIPFQIGPDMKADMYHRNRERQDFSPTLERAESLLSDAQIAIYPVDVSGLAVLGVDSSFSGRTFTGSGKAHATAIQDQYDEQWDNRVAMKNLADETGGKAFFGTNDLAAAIGDGIELGSKYYTLAYVPSSFKPDGKYRSIKVESTQGALELKYRRGYIASNIRPPTGTEAAQVLASSMQIGVPASTALLMRVQVLPPDSEHKTVRVDYAFAPGDISFGEATDHRQHATLDLLAVAWSDKAQPALSTSNTEEVAFKEGTPDDNFRAGVPGHQEFKLAPGKYMLCLGAMDRSTQKIGTVWVPLVIPDTK
jgi:VWFA-related protein